MRAPLIRRRARRPSGLGADCATRTDGLQTGRGSPYLPDLSTTLSNAGWNFFKNFVSNLF